MNRITIFTKLAASEIGDQEDKISEKLLGVHYDEFIQFCNFIKGIDEKITGFTDTFKDESIPSSIDTVSCIIEDNIMVFTVYLKDGTSKIFSCTGEYSNSKL